MYSKYKLGFAIQTDGPTHHPAHKQAEDLSIFFSPRKPELSMHTSFKLGPNITHRATGGRAKWRRRPGGGGGGYKGSLQCRLPESCKSAILLATHARQQLRLHSSTPSTCSMKFLREILEDIVGATSVPPWSTGTCDFEGLFSFLIPSVDSVCMHDGCTQPTRMWRNLLGLHLLLGDTYSREIECFRQWSFANVFRFFAFID